ncbi:rRNA methyltransferase 3, mitochondrial [Trichoplusia ni]|uniref:rRNA methyltransferase 3, mitochondrial n=1 Tax=Trichoplusia ni TaxID=7111 RepID=A0A7E5WP72_TRINI|nr:rRNA methyltransferase 3, mitochondrial [Trichoplusia ni]
MAKNINKLFVKKILGLSPAFQSVRLYARWSHRSTAKVLLPFDEKSKGNIKKEKVIDLDPSIFNKSKALKESITSEIDIKNQNKQSTLAPEKSQQIKQKREEKLKKLKFNLSQQKVFDENSEIIYEKLKDNDARVSSLLVKLKSKKERMRSGHMLVEGWRLIMDGLEAKCLLKYVFFSRIDELNRLRPFLPKTGVQLYKIPYKEVTLWSDLENSPGIFGVFETPSAENVRTQSKPLPLQFICDNIRVPGNLGAILRVAVGAGCEKVLLSKGCVDVWDPKVVRSAAGAHFRLPIYHSIDWNEMPNHMEADTSLFIADSNTTPVEDATEADDKLESLQMRVLPYYGVDFTTLKHTTLIIGGETEGVSYDSYALAGKHNGLRLNIPLQRGVDSLNTGMAAAVIAFEIRKQLIKKWTQDKLERQFSESK